MNDKILVVDDEKEFLQTALSFIIEESIPYALLCAPNGKIAIEVAKKELPDIIIMDWEMPEMNGIEAIKELKKNEKTKDIPIIISTGLRLTPQDLKIAFDAGASDYIKKPLEKAEFIARVSSHLKMADFIKTIKKQENSLSIGKLIKLNEKMETQEAKMENDKVLFQFFNNTLKTFLTKIESVDTSGNTTKENIETIVGQVNQSIQCIKNNYSDLDKPGKSFMKSLMKEHNNLTLKEIELCFMIKNKLSSKEIASITFREETSVKVSRSRLRKKLNLKECDNLLTYIEQY